MTKRVPKYFFRLIKLVVLSCLISQVSPAQTIHSTIDKKDILIGQPVNYDLIIDLPSREYNIDLVLPDSIPHFEVLQTNTGDTTDKAGKFSRYRHISFTSFDSGTWAFPPLQYRISRLNTASQPLYTDSVRINVGYMPIDKGDQPRDIKSVIEVSIFDWLWIYIGAGVLALLLLIFFLYRYFKRRKKQVDPYKGAASAYEEALSALEQLRLQNREGILPVKEFHTALADVFKRYYGRSAGQDLMNRTTEEILLKLREYALNAEANSTAARALHTVDAVKFAKYHPTFIENEAALDYVKSTIEQMELTSKPGNTTN